MNSIKHISVLLPFIFLLTYCSKTDSPTEIVPLNKGEYTGTFSVTFNDYKNHSFSLIQAGTISIVFSDSDYEYSAKADYSSIDFADTYLTDRGKYVRSEDKIIMQDVSWELMDLRWHNSLYLLDTFNFQTIGNQLIISQENSFANWKINLTNKR